MSKYDLTFKLSVVRAYDQLGLGYRRLSKQFGVDTSTVRYWVRLFQLHGDEALKPRLTQSSYSIEFKKKLVNQVLCGNSLTSVSSEYALPDKFLLAQWLHSHQKTGTLIPKQQGRPMKKQTIQSTIPDEEKSKTELLKELEYLRVENAYLKKLKALIAEKEAKKKPKR